MPRLKVRAPSTEAFVDARLIARVRAALAGVPKVVEKRMFGGTGFMVRGNLCVTARPTRIMCRIDPSTHNSAIKRKGCRTVVMKGRDYLGYVHVDAAVIKTEKALLYWVNRALEFNRSLPRRRTAR
jgi:TfoX/Sxy family transcriptional regulator of competence genes